jgi:hypothetical protein
VTVIKARDLTKTYLTTEKKPGLADWQRLAVLVVVAAMITSMAWGVFRWGLRRYESGNLVTVRG